MSQVNHYLTTVIGALQEEASKLPDADPQIVIGKLNEFVQPYTGVEVPVSQDAKNLINVVALLIEYQRQGGVLA